MDINPREVLQRKKFRRKESGFRVRERSLQKEEHRQQERSSHSIGEEGEVFSLPFSQLNSILRFLPFCSLLLQLQPSVSRWMRPCSQLYLSSLSLSLVSINSTAATTTQLSFFPHVLNLGSFPSSITFLSTSST